MSRQNKSPDFLMFVLSFGIISALYALSSETSASEAAPDTDIDTKTIKLDPITKIEPANAPTELIEDKPDITKPDENANKNPDEDTKGSESQMTDVSDITKTKPEAQETLLEAAPSESEQRKPTLSERVQIFIPSEDIDTEKAVAFPTNI